MKMAILLAAALSGCVSSYDVQPGNGCAQNGPQPANVQKVSFLCVGMENSQRFGSCPGCERDAKRMTDLLSGEYGYPGETLISSKATKSSVSAKLKAGIEGTPQDGLFIFAYSGHGGQEYLGGKEPDGADAQDEYLCLYDMHMTDDEIWSIVSKCRGRVFLYFDACHSATMYRSVASDVGAGASGKPVARAMGIDGKALIRSAGFSFSPSKFARASAMSADSGQSPRMLCWSGCREAEYSYGSNSGGVLTTGVMNGWKSGISYSRLWAEACGWVEKKEPTQHPVQTSVGDFSDTLEAFR